MCSGKAWIEIEGPTDGKKMNLKLKFSFVLPIICLV